jgi:SAM-dependent methyltransferase
MSSWTSGYVADIGYTHGFYRELTPAMLGLVALARGQRSPVNGGPLTYCELGCGQGFSVNLLAAANPHIDFYATDFNPAHIVGAKALAEEAGTPNVHFYDDSFAEFLDRPELPVFDIISLHGIYSWIAAEHRATIVEFIRRKLKPGGLVYISYNALPGWSAAAPLRHLMYMHGKVQGGPTGSRLDPALAFIDRMVVSNAAYFRANPLLKDRYDRIKGQNRNYLAHEYMNDAWTLLYHSDVVAELSEAKVSFVGSAALLEHIDAINLTAEQQQIMAEITDPVLRETVKDYMMNQQFRRDVFVKGGVGLSAVEAQNIWLDLRFVLSVQRDDVPLTVKGTLGDANLQAETYTPLLDAFAGGPKTVRQLLSDEKIAALGWARIQQALIILTGAGHLHPALDEKNDRKRTERTRAFNTAVMNRAQFSADLGFLASPVTGGGIVLDRFAQLFLLAQQQKQPDPARMVWDVLNRQGQRIVKEGKTLESADENIIELRDRVETFTTKQVPVLKQLGIA